jgi:hypothetical protein
MTRLSRIIETLRNIWNRLGTSWQWAIGGVVVVRVLYGIWSVAILLLSSLAVQNLTLHGEPVLSIFDLRSSQGYLYNRVIEGEVLTFRAARPDGLIDRQTGSRWDVSSGRAVAGSLAGESLSPAATPVEEVFPYHGVKPYPIGWLAVWQRFDTTWFQKIAERGYAPDDNSTAYFPLYPLLIRLVALLVGNTLPASLIVATLALFGALFLFHRISVEYSDAGSANRSFIYLLVFPVAFFLLAGYTESTYLAFVLAAFLFARKKRWLLASAFGWLAALTRGTGMLLFIPLFYMWWSQGKKRRWQDAVAVLLIPSGAAAYLLLTGLGTFRSYQTHWQLNLAFPWEHFTELGRLIANHLVTPTDILNLGITLSFGCFCVVAWFKLPRELGLYAVLMFLLPLFGLHTGQPFASMARYVLVIFPVFILWGKWGRNAWVNRLILYSSFAGALFFSAQFWMWGWVG